VHDAVTSEAGLPLTFSASGASTIPAGTVTARQSWLSDFYSVSGQALVGSVRSYQADVAPIPPQGTGALPATFLPANQAITPVNIAALAQDVQGDTLSVSISGLPAGLSISGQTLIGTTGGNAVTPVTVTWTNNSTDSASATYNLVIGSEVMPNLAGLIGPGIIPGLLAGLYVGVTFGSGPDPNPAGPSPVGTVIAQNPVAGAPLTPGSTVLVTLSNGQAPAVTNPNAVGNVISSQLQTTYSLGSILSYGVFEDRGATTMSANDPPGMVYRFCAVPASAEIIELQIMNDANPSGSSYKIGLYGFNQGPLVIPGSDSLLIPAGLSLDVARPFWTSLYTPIKINTPASVANVGKRVWELLGFSADPSPPTQDVLYDVCMTAITPGQLGGNIALRILYRRGPDRGMIAAASVK